MIKQYFFHKKAFDIFYSSGGVGSISANYRFTGSFVHYHSNNLCKIATTIDNHGVWPAIDASYTDLFFHLQEIK